MLLGGIFIAGVGDPSSVKPVRGIDVIVECPRCKPPVEARAAKTDAEGGFNFSDLPSGEYKVRLQCKECERSVAGKPTIEVTLTGTKQRDLKKAISKERLVAGVTLAVDVLAKQISGRVTQVEK